MLQDCSIPEVGRRLNIPKSSLHKWVSAERQGKLGEFGQGQRVPTEQEMELARLRRDLKRADEAERRAIEELRVMGQEILRGWAQRRADEESQVLEKTDGFVRQVKETPLAQHLR